MPVGSYTLSILYLTIRIPRFNWIIKSSCVIVNQSASRGVGILYVPCVLMRLPPPSTACV